MVKAFSKEQNPAYMFAIQIKWSCRKARPSLYTPARAKSVISPNYNFELLNVLEYKLYLPT